MYLIYIFSSLTWCSDGILYFRSHLQDLTRHDCHKMCSLRATEFRNVAGFKVPVCLLQAAGVSYTGKKTLLHATSCWHGVVGSAKMTCCLSTN